MQLTIEGQPRNFMPVQTFRDRWNLPGEFGVDFFEPKEWDGLGSMKGAGEALSGMRDELIDAVPQAITPQNALSTVDLLAHTFRAQLKIANKQIGLRFHEVGFAVAGFQDVIRNVIYQLLRLNHTYQGAPALINENFDYDSAYQSWLEASVRLSFTVHTYHHDNYPMNIRIVNHIYGRVGLEVRVADDVYFVLDKSLACPGETFMWELCRDVAQTLCERYESGGN